MKSTFSNFSCEASFCNNTSTNYVDLVDPNRIDYVQCMHVSNSSSNPAFKEMRRGATDRSQCVTFFAP